MEKILYEEKKADYRDLLRAIGDLLERFKDYTPEKKGELDELIEKACYNCEDLPKGKELFQILRNYIIYRCTELQEYKIRREKAEKKFMDALPDMFDMLAVPKEDSCATISALLEEHDNKNNYQILVEGVIQILCEL